MTAKEASIHTLREEIDQITRELSINWKELSAKLEETALLRRARNALEQRKLECEKIAFPLGKALAPLFLKYPELMDIPAEELRNLFKKCIPII